MNFQKENLSNIEITIHLHCQIHQTNVVLVSVRIRLAPKTKVPCATREHHQVMSSDDDISLSHRTLQKCPYVSSLQRLLESICTLYIYVYMYIYTYMYIYVYIPEQMKHNKTSSCHLEILTQRTFNPKIKNKSHRQPPLLLETSVAFSRGAFWHFVRVLGYSPYSFLHCLGRKWLDVGQFYSMKTTLTCWTSLELEE